MDISIRNITHDDLEIVKIINEATLPENYPRKLWEFWISNYAKYSFVSVCNLSINGYIISDNEKIISFAVRENYRHNNIGTKLFLNCLNSTTNDIVLHCRKSNIVALNMYKKYDFIITKEISNYYKDKEDAYEMKRKYDTNTIHLLNNIKNKNDLEKLKKKYYYIKIIKNHLLM